MAKSRMTYEEQGSKTHSVGSYEVGVSKVAMQFVEFRGLVSLLSGICLKKKHLCCHLLFVSA